MRLLKGVQIGVCLAALPFGAGAQATLTGSVRDRGERTAVPLAEVIIPSLRRTARTDSLGRFSLSGLAAGRYTVEVRRMGYVPFTVTIGLDDGETRDQTFLIDRTAVSLGPVNVTAATTRIREFEDNRRTGLGKFFSAADLQRLGVPMVGQALDGLASVRMVRGNGSEAWAVSSRSGRRVISPDFFSMKRGAKPNCYSIVYVDGVKQYGGRDEDPLFDVNSIAIERILAVEYYAGPAEIPVRYASLDISCGVLSIWTDR